MKKIIFMALFLVLLPQALLAVDFSLHGYYRYRFENSYQLDTQGTNNSLAFANDRFGLVSFNQMRLRLDPSMKLNDNISLHAQFDILDNVLFGTYNNEQMNVYNPLVGAVDMPAGAGSISLNGGEAGENGSINVRRMWADILTPIGKLRIGRQPSHWGLGIFVNDGNGRQSDFGDTSDRVMYIARYEFDAKNAVNFGLVGDTSFEAQMDPSINGMTGTVNKYNRDTMQFAAFLIYDNPNFNLGFFGGTRRRTAASGARTTTAYGLPETECSSVGWTDPACLHPDRDGDGLSDTTYTAGQDGNTRMYFLDGYLSYEYEQYRFQLEGVYVFGKISTGVAIDAIPFDGLAQGTNHGIIELIPQQDVQVLLAASEIDAVYGWGGEWKLMGGFAQGDSNPLSSKITEFGFRPDYDVALMMFDMPLGTSPTLRQNGNKRLGGVPLTANYVNNAYYVSGGYKHRFDITGAIKECNEFKIGAKVTTAWAHKNLFDMNFDDLINPGVNDGLPIFRSSNKWYGWEVDLSVEGTFFEHLYTGIEGGIFFPGSAYDVEADPYNPVNTANINTIPADAAEMAYMGRLTMMVEF